MSRTISMDLREPATARLDQDHPVRQVAGDSNLVFRLLTLITMIGFGAWRLLLDAVADKAETPHSSGAGPRTRNPNPFVLCG